MAEGVLSQLLNTAQEFAPVLAAKYGYGADKTNDRDILDERIRLNRINGSGPVNPVLAANQPMSIEERLFGQGNILATSVKAGGGIIGIAVIALVVWFIVRR